MDLGNDGRLRRLVKTGLARAVRWSRVDEWIGSLAERRRTPVVIGYHRVVEDFVTEARRAIPAMLISRRMLERHLDWLGCRFRFVSLDEVGARLDRGESFEPPAVALTFDDGYRDVYEHAFPLLKRKGIPAAVFVVTDLIGTAGVQLFDKLYLLLGRALGSRPSSRHDLAELFREAGIRLPETARRGSAAGDPFLTVRALLGSLPHGHICRVIGALEAAVGIDQHALAGLAAMSWEMLREMQQNGMTIGSHTKSHALLTHASQDRALEETAGSKRELEGKLGMPVKHFAYPDGRFGPAAVSAVASSGYRYAYTTCRHRDPRFPWLTIPRTVLWQKSCLDALGEFSSAIMHCQMNGIFDGDCAQPHGSLRWPRPMVSIGSRRPRPSRKDSRVEAR